MQRRAGVVGEKELGQASRGDCAGRQWPWYLAQHGKASIAQLRYPVGLLL